MDPKQWIQNGTTVAGLKGTIEFIPNNDCAPCKEIKLIQMIRIQDISSGNWTRDNLTGTQGAYQIPVERDVPTPLVDAARRLGVEEGWFMDVNGENIRIWKILPTIFYQDDFPHPDNKVGSAGNDKPTTSSSIYDDPHHSLANKRFEFETAAFCVDTGKFLGSVRWGFVTKDSDKGVVSEALPTSESLGNAPSISIFIVSALLQMYYQGK